MRISNNLPAMNTWRQLQQNSRSVSKNLEKLSSGYRINSAGDDAAGLAISEKMRAQIRGLNMASKNVHDGISLIQTAEGALQSTHNVLQRMRELAVQAASDTNEQTIDRAALEQEFLQLKREVDDTASKTRFNDQNLIDGTFARAKGGAVSTTTSLVQAAPGSAVISAGGLAEGDYTITAGYTAKGADGTVVSAPEITLGSLSGTATHGITLESVELSSPNGAEDWLGIDFEELRVNSMVSDYIITELSLITNVVFDSGNRITFPCSATPVTVNESNNVIEFRYIDRPSTGELILANGEYKTAQELADAINQAFEQFNTENGTSYKNIASTDGEGRLVWDNSTDHLLQPSRGSFFPSLWNEKKFGIEFSFADLPLSFEQFNASKKFVFSNGSRTITFNFSGELSDAGNFLDFFYDFSDDLRYGSLFTATYAQVTDDPPEAYYEITLNGDTVQVFDGDTSVSVGGATINFGAAVSVPETGGDASALDTLLGDKAFSITQTTVTTSGSGGRTLVLQTGANQGDELAINIEAMNAETLGIKDSSVATRLAASAAITETNTAINRVSTQRAELGAMQNRMTHKVQNLDISAENLQAAESRIRDVDMAREMTVFTQRQIITQASQAMLAQANAVPQQVLSLLQ